VVAQQREQAPAAVGAPRPPKAALEEREAAVARVWEYYLNHDLLQELFLEHKVNIREDKVAAVDAAWDYAYRAPTLHLYLDGGWVVTVIFTRDGEPRDVVVEPAACTCASDGGW
jgi:hypothetical protein